MSINDFREVGVVQGQRDREVLASNAVSSYCDGTGRSARACAAAELG